MLLNIFNARFSIFNLLFVVVICLASVSPSSAFINFNTKCQFIIPIPTIITKVEEETFTLLFIFLSPMLVRKQAIDESELVVKKHSH